MGKKHTLLHISSISKIADHPRTHDLQVATVDRKQVVIKRGELKIGSKVVHFYPGTLVPKGWADVFGVSQYLIFKPWMGGKGLVTSRNFSGTRSYGFLRKVMDPADTDTSLTKRYDLGHESMFRRGKEKKKAPMLMLGERVATTPGFTEVADYLDMETYGGVIRPGTPVVFSERVHGVPCRIGVIWDAPTKKWKTVLGNRDTQFSTASKSIWSLALDAYDLWPIFQKAHRLNGNTACSVILHLRIVGGRISKLNYGRPMSALLTDIQCDDTFINYSDMKDMAKEAKIPIAPEYCIGPFHENLATELAEETSLFEDGISATLGKGIMIRPLRERLSDAGRVAFSVSNPAFKPAERLFCD